VVLKPGHLLRIGDRLTLRHGRVLREITVLALADRRGSAAEARLLYAEAAAPVPLRVAERAGWVPLIEE
jgi:ribosomal 50S subunit-recycling heat shock protein